MKNLIYLTLTVLLFATLGCEMEDPEADTRIIVDPVWPTLTEVDTIVSGSYLGFEINKDAAAIYKASQSLRETKGIMHLNVVGNIFSDVRQLSDRVPLYSYMLFDQQQGTETGVQITLEDGKVKSLFLNNGKQMRQWPEKSKTAVKVGDPADGLYEKLADVSRQKSYSNKFERISLLTKDLNTAFDPGMMRSPQWYFRYRTSSTTSEHVDLHLKDGKLSYIVLMRYHD